VFVAFLLEGKITGALNALSAPEIYYSSASYAFAVTKVGLESTVELIFGLPWIADLASRTSAIAGFAYFMVFTSFLAG
jgi:hypothetical protein